MKKILLASTALLLGGVVSAQAAEPIKLSLGGFMKQQVILANNQVYMHENSVDEQGFGQVNFTGSTKLDNGIAIGVAVETLATQWNDSRNASGARYADTGVSGSRAYGNTNVRRAYMTATSGFGQLVLGQREDYGFISGVYAPDVGWGLQDGDWANVMGYPTSHAANLTNNNSRYSSRADKITVVSPTLAGFSAGASYVPDIRQSWTGDLTQAQGVDGLASSLANTVTATNANSLINRGDFMGDQYQVGVAYKNTLGPVGVAGNFAFSQYNMANMKTYQAGLNLTYAGFTLGGSIFDRDVGSSDRVTVQNVTTAAYGGTYSNSVSKSIMHAGLGWDAGLSYAFDAFAVSVGYFHDTTKRDGTIDAYGGMADSTQVYALSGKYTMGPGVEFRNSLYYTDYKNNNNYVAPNDAGKAATNNSGVAFMTGLQVAF